MAALWTLVNGALKPRNAPAIVAYGRALAQAAANASVATFTVGSADGSFEVSYNLLVTATSGTTAFTVECAYTDEASGARVLSLDSVGSGSAGGVQYTVSIVNASGTIAYAGRAALIRAKAGTSITIRTQAAGTYTTVTYNIEGLIKQVN
jgi:hypothetical protein